MYQLLYGYGYLDVRPTGYYGEDTFHAVVVFQSRNGLYADGVAGTATQQCLLSNNVIPPEVVGSMNDQIPVIQYP